MHATHNTLSENIRAQSAALLNLHLAAAIDLHGQLKQAHGNVRSPGFMAVHELFDDVSGEVENYPDMIAERAGGVGSTAFGDADTADLLTKVSRGVDRQLWFVESHAPVKAHVRAVQQ